MDHTRYPQRLKSIWQDAVARYSDGQQEPQDFFAAATRHELAGFGLNTMDVFDYAEDYVARGEPDFETFLMVCEARRDYFLHVQHGIASTQQLDPDTLPPKDEAINGIVWLPRILAKAHQTTGRTAARNHVRLRGRPPLFRSNNIHPAEFLRRVWAHETDPAQLIEWVARRRDCEAVKTAS